MVTHRITGLQSITGHTHIHIQGQLRVSSPPKRVNSSQKSHQHSSTLSPWSLIVSSRLWINFKSWDYFIMSLGASVVGAPVPACCSLYFEVSSVKNLKQTKTIIKPLQSVCDWVKLFCSFKSLEKLENSPSEGLKSAWPWKKFLTSMHWAKLRHMTWLIHVS